jgi:hypothetical protein
MGRFNTRPNTSSFKANSPSAFFQKFVGGAAVDTIKMQEYCTEWIKKIKQYDFDAAVGIASHANMNLRDKYQNISKDVWCRNSGKEEMSTGQLISDDLMNELMNDHLKEHIAKNKSLLMQCDNDTLCSWIMKFIGDWQKQYRGERNTNDISESILSIMSETVQYMTPYMEDTVFNVAALEETYSLIHRTENWDALASSLKKPTFLERDRAVTRFYFRHQSISRYMILIAGKMLQKRESNRMGSFCSTRQRNDVAREFERAVADMKFKLRSTDYTGVLDRNWCFWALDHTEMIVVPNADNPFRSGPAASK